MLHVSCDIVVELFSNPASLHIPVSQCIIFYVVQLPDLPQRLALLAQCLRAHNFTSANYCDLDPAFIKATDEDFDDKVNGVTKRLFMKTYKNWMLYCLRKQPAYSVSAWETAGLCVSVWL